MAEHQDSPIRRFLHRHFLSEQFAHYTWIGIFISLLNIFLLWLFIDVFQIPTVISSVIVIGSTFVLRYLLYIFVRMV